MNRLRYREDAELMPEVAAATHRGVHRSATWVLILVGLGLGGFFLWAAQQEVDEVTKGEGRVIPSSQNQIVQHLEGGIVREILVREGEIVEAGQTLLRIENRMGEADYEESRARYVALLAKAARLDAEVSNAAEIEFPKTVLDEAPAIAERERRDFLSRRASLAGEIEVLQQEVRQREQALREQQSLVASLSTKVASLRRQVEDGRRMVAQNALSRLELLRWERELVDTEGEMRTERLRIPRTRSSIEETRQKIEDRRNEAVSDARKELNEARSQLAMLSEKIQDLWFRVSRTEVRSPVRGTVKTLRISTPGGVVKAGDPIVEIVPLEDSLLIEARILPSDIAFLRPGQPVLVKVTAYEYQDYGGLDGILLDISADTIEDNTRRGETFYRVRVRTDRNYLLREGRKHEIVPGMTANVNIRTGRKTVLDYIFKPITKWRQRLPDGVAPPPAGPRAPEARRAVGDG